MATTGDDDGDAVAGTPWRDFPLLVGEEPVGVLSVRAATDDGLEARQERVVAQLAPTVALVARAVALAVEAEHARSDLSCEREAERNRILADLHDDLGPMLAGMSMRVGAAQQLSPTPALAALAEDLAAARSDLRRIVAGLTPSALAGQGAEVAITRLVDSFRTDTGPDIELVGGVPAGLGPESTIAVYRTVAEAVTNALRHADPSHVTVRIEHHVHADAGTLTVSVADDGRGGVVVPGVGLTSLRSRARDLGGTLDVSRTPPVGTLLTLTLPDAHR